VPHYCDTGPRFFRSHLKDFPIQSLLTTHMGMRRTYSNADPLGGIEFEVKGQVTLEIGIYCLLNIFRIHQTSYTGIS
jgi:hypothetical protein